MKIGINIIGIAAGTDAQSIRTIAEHAERLNFNTLWAPEHVVLMDNYTSKYPYSESGRTAGSMDFPLLNPFVALAYAAAFTSRIRLATGICLVPEHNPVVLAKEIASLDHLSGGRFMLGVGIGWLEEEFRALGIPWERRARRTIEYIEAMQRLWTDDVSSYKGEFVNFEGVRSFPKPVSGGKLPIIFGGESEPALKRVARYGTGWFGMNLTTADAAQKIARLRELMAMYNRKPEDVELMVGPKTRLSTDDLKRLRDLGVQEVVVPSWGRRPDVQEHVRRLEDAARTLVEPAAALG
jgi:probable F420-dependent oxidoreductase